MRTTWMAAAAIAACLVAGGALADEAEDAYWVIQALGDKKLETTGKTRDTFRDEAIAFFADIVDKCEAFVKRFPDASWKGEVVYEEAKAYLYRSRYSKTRKEDVEKAAELARKAVAINPKAEAAAKSRGLLIQYYMMYKKPEEALREAQAIVADHPNSTDAPLALRYVAEISETLKKDKEAQAAWERLVAEYPETPQGKRAAGILAFPKLKGQAFEMAFTSTTGEKVDAKDFRGRVLLVFFWSPGDVTSTGNLALIGSADKMLHAKGLTVLGVCLESRPEMMDAAIRKAEISWPHHNDGKKWDNEFVVAFGIRTLPTSILVDRSGKIREVGLLGTELIEATRRLLDEPEKK